MSWRGRVEQVGRWAGLVGIGFALSETASAQSATGCVHALTGIVRGQENRPGASATALPGVTVYVRELARGAAADSTGRYVLGNLCPGRYTLEFSRVGYAPVVRTLRVPAGPAGTTDVWLWPDAIGLQEVIVTGQRPEADQLLQTRTELSGAALLATRGQSLGESLKTLTGLYTVQTGPTVSKPVIHGLYSNRIIILNNGIRQEDQQWGGEHAPQIDPFIAQRVTVIKGAASIRYGSDAIGGVILVEPKALPTQPGVGGEVNVVGATNGRMGVGSAFVEGAFGKKLAGLSWRVQGTLKRAGYVRTPTYFLENTSYHETNGSADVHYHRARWGVGVYYSRFDTEVGLFTGAQVGSLADLYAAIRRPEPLAQPGFSYRLDRPYQAVAHELLKGRAYLRSDRLGTLTATVARQQNVRQEYDYVSFSGVLNPELYLNLVTHTADLIWEPATKRTRTGGNWSGSLGFNGLTQSNVRAYLFLIPNFRSYGAGSFATGRYARGRWTLEGGLRYDYRWLRAYFLAESTNRVYYATHAWRNSTGSLGAVWQWRPGLTLTATLSTAWRAPNVADLYANGLHQSAVAYEIGNPDLKPEQAQNGNLALAYAGKRLSAEVGVYNNLIHNYIYLKPDSVPIVRQRGAFPAYSYTQVNARFGGVDATVTYKLTNRLSLTSKTSLLFATDQTNHGYLVAIPPNRTDNSLRYEWAGKRAGRPVAYVSISGLYVARQHRAPAVTSQLNNGRIVFTGDFAPPPPAYVLLGAEVGGSLEVAGRPIHAVLSGTNLANVAYRDYLNRFRYFAHEPGRNVTLRLRVPF